MLTKLQDLIQSKLCQYEPDSAHALTSPKEFSHIPNKTVLFGQPNKDVKSKAKRIGIVFSGGPAPGGHDVLVGILSHLRKGDELIGFIGGFGGMLNGQYFLIDAADKDLLEGTAGFDYLGTDRTKISSDEQFEIIRNLVSDLSLNALIVVGGDDSNTNAFYLSQALGDECAVIGVPKTIDGDLKRPPYLNVTFGFHTATQHYSRQVTNLKIDAQATGKYFHMVKLMGRSASHVVLEVAHQTEPHACLLAEEVMKNAWGLIDVIDYFVDAISTRIAAKKPYGVMIFPEGLVEVIPEIKAYINGDDSLLKDAYYKLGLRGGFVNNIMRDSHGNVNLSLIPLETILIDCLTARLKTIKNGDKATFVAHFYGYEGRSSQPTDFDVNYSRVLGKTAYELVLSNQTGMIAGLKNDGHTLQPCGIPLVCMLDFDLSKDRFIIKKELVNCLSDEYLHYIQNKGNWTLSDIGFPRKPVFDSPTIF
jgi:pyrophosphate--fructose-6-phosphate 1-phosphotransferase